jgi:inner membrane protein
LPWASKEIVSRRLLLAAVAASTLPDLDVVAFSFGIPYEHEFGHRGFSHSFFFAAFVALVGACAHRSLNSSFGIAFGFLFLVTASHGVLDAFTNGGLGIALFWPWWDQRYFARFQLIEVSPIGISHFSLGGGSESFFPSCTGSGCPARCWELGCGSFLGGGRGFCFALFTELALEPIDHESNGDGG